MIWWIYIKLVDLHLGHRIIWAIIKFWMVLKQSIWNLCHVMQISTKGWWRAPKVVNLWTRFLRTVKVRHLCPEYLQVQKIQWKITKRWIKCFKERVVVEIISTEENPKNNPDPNPNPNQNPTLMQTLTLNIINQILNLRLSLTLTLTLNLTLT